MFVCVSTPQEANYAHNEIEEIRDLSAHGSLEKLVLDGQHMLNCIEYNYMHVLVHVHVHVCSICCNVHYVFLWYMHAHTMHVQYTLYCEKVVVVLINKNR